MASPDTGPTSARGSTRSPTCPRPTGRPTTTSTRDPGRPTGPTPAGADSSSRWTSRRWSSASPPTPSRPPTPPSSWDSWSPAARSRTPATATGRPGFDRERVSVILGVTGTLELVIPLGARLGHPIWRRALQSAGVDDATAEDVVRRIADSYVGWQENSFPGLLGNVVAGRIANRLDLRGTNCVVNAACASSLGAVNLALLELAAGRSDIAVTGGLDTFNDIFMYMCFSKTPALSPTGEARPFDAEADGTILGEGLGVLVLKRLADARRDGDRVYAVIRAIGTSSDGKGQAVYAPSAAGQARALRQAYSLAGDLAGHRRAGRGPRHRDEGRRRDRAGGAGGGLPGGAAGRRRGARVGSVKSQMGHTKAAAGAAGLIKAAMALHHKVLPPTLKVRRPSESLARGDSPFYLNTEARPWLNAGDGTEARGRQRLRLRRQQFPLRARGGRAREAGGRLGRRRAGPGLLGRRSGRHRPRAGGAGRSDGLAGGPGGRRTEPGRLSRASIAIAC